MDVENSLVGWFNNADERYMREALREARKAADADEVPVGAVVVYENRIIARAHNQVEMLNDATAHAEMIALTQASAYLNNWRLTGATLVVTKEPCPMCCGAMVNARLGAVIYGVPDERYGAARSGLNILENGVLNHRVQATAGILADECRGLLQAFFAKKRNK